MSEARVQRLDRQDTEELTAEQAEAAQGGIGEQYGRQGSLSIINSIEFTRLQKDASSTPEG